MKFTNYAKKLAALTFAITIGTTCLLSQNPLCHADPTTHHVGYDQTSTAVPTAAGWTVHIHMGQPHSPNLSNMVFLEPVLFNLTPTTGPDGVVRLPMAVVPNVTYQCSVQNFVFENTQQENQDGMCTYPDINVIGEFGQSLDLQINLPNVDKYQNSIWWKWSYRHMRRGITGATTSASGGIVPAIFDHDLDWMKTTGGIS
jgi:hypothetical protein